MRRFQKSFGEWRGGMYDDLTGENWRELFNVIVTPDNKISTRWPAKTLSGSLPADAQGLIDFDGAWYTIVPRGATIELINDFASVSPLAFDPPPGASATWTLLDWAILQNVVCAVIRHGMTGGVASLIMLHVFDGADGLPTYVLDGAAPTSWNPQVPQHTYGSTTAAGSWQDYTPRIIAAHDKLWMTRADGNVAFSAIGRPRIWNLRTPDSIPKAGEWFYALATGDTTTWTVPIPFAELAEDRKWAGYITEICLNGTWTKLVETTSIAGNLQVSYASANPAWASAVTAITARVDGGAGQWLRARFCTVPEVAIVTGCAAPGSTFELFLTGDGSTYQFQTDVITSDFSASYTVSVNGQIKAASYYTVTDVNGKARVDFQESRITASLGQTIFNTTVPYAAATDVDIADVRGVTISVNGVIQTTGFTLSDTGGNCTITFITALSEGDELIARLVPAVDRPIRFASTTLIRGGGVIRFENATYDVSPILSTDLTPLTDYLVGVAVPGFTSFWLDTTDMPANGYERYHVLLQSRITTAVG